MDNHPTSGRRKGSKGTRLKRQTKVEWKLLDKQVSRLDKDDEVMLRNGRMILEHRVANVTHTLRRKKRFIVASAILGWKIHKKQTRKLTESKST